MLDKMGMFLFKRHYIKHNSDHASARQLERSSAVKMFKQNTRLMSFSAPSSNSTARRKIDYRMLSGL
uniref:Uncharacterized protein n=1 Tax=Anopheles atroparvus TaxID=41427 RepID=A0AAG5DQQ2_ANOAO